MNAATKTVPAVPGCPVVTGPEYPPQARVRVERYWYHLHLAREAGSREQAAGRARAMGQAAGEAAAALAGCPQAAPAAHTEPLAWADVSAHLAGLAMALDGAPAGTSGPVFDPAPYRAWEHLAQAASRREFAAAWRPVGEYLRRCAGLDGSQAGGDEPELRAFAAGQVVMAASAILGAPW